MKLKTLNRGLPILLLSLVLLQAQAQVPNREFRAVWVSTVFKLDWPKANVQATQKTELINLFDKIQAANLNAVLLQVRTECDAFYNSSKEPWSRYLTGTQGGDPGYDPLAFAIEEAHKRGLELHAWMNPFRVNASTVVSTVYSDDHVSNTHPEWILEFSTGQKILNPALPEVREYIASVAGEVAENYAIDGIHFDDYFYPYPSDGFSGITNEDAADYATYGTGFPNIKDWRRNNINETIRLVSEAIEAVKPAARFGVSPFGIWKNGVPAGITGMNAYDVIYADATNWLQNQYVDYLTPQLYWKIGGNQDFKKLLEWWTQQAFDASRHLYSGHSLYDINSSGRISHPESIAQMERAEGSVKPGGSSFRTKAQPVTEVPNQIAIVRDNRAKNALGSVFFRASNLAANPSGFADYLKEHTYTYPAAPPAMAWLPEATPAAPDNLAYSVSEGTGNFLINWQRPAGNTHTFKRYLLYQLTDASGDVPATDAVRCLCTGEEMEIDYAEMPIGTSYWGVTELGPYNHESPLSNIIEIQKIVPVPSAPVVIAPVQQETSTADQFFRFEWQEQAGVTAYHYQWATNADFTALLQESDALAPSSKTRLFTNLQVGSTYYFRLRAANEAGWGEWTPAYKVTVEQVVTDVDEPALVNNFNVYPNPSSGRLFLEFNMQRTSVLSVEIMSPIGSRSVRVVDGLYSAGKHTIPVDRNLLGAGLYVVLLRSGSLQEARKVIFN